MSNFSVIDFCTYCSNVERNPSLARARIKPGKFICISRQSFRCFNFFCADLNQFNLVKVLAYYHHFFSLCTGSKTSLPYSRATELGILIGIPMACSAIMLTVVAVLFVKSVHDSEGTYYGYGKHRNKDKIHSCLVRMTTSIAHVGAVGYVNKGRHFSRSSIRSIPSVQSLPGAHSSEHSQPNSPVEAPEITITPGTPEADRRLDIAKVLASSNASIEQDRFQSVTSLENLLSKRYIKPKTRKLRSLKKPDAVVTPAGAAGKYIKKDERFEFYEA